MGQKILSTYKLKTKLKALEDETLEMLKTLIGRVLDGKDKVVLEDVGVGFEDDASNQIHTIDGELVYFGESDSYPLMFLSMEDMFYLIDELGKLPVSE